MVINDGQQFDYSKLEPFSRVMPISIIELNTSSGPSIARNLGIDHSRGKYLAFLDDDLFLQNHLSQAIQTIEQKSLDFLYMGAIVLEKRLETGMSISPYSITKEYEYDERFLLIANNIHTGSVVTRNFRDSPVRFQSDLYQCEDWDMWLRLVSELRYKTAYGKCKTTIYHQIPENAGIVANSQLSSPSPFTIARQYIYKKWPSHDTSVSVYRDWMTEFEEYRDSRITEGDQMPNLLFDSVLGFLNECMVNKINPTSADIEIFF